jgi:hypothetical protein
MNLLVADVLALLNKYAAPVATYLVTFAGLVAANANGNLAVGTGTAAVVSAVPAVSHLVGAKAPAKA